MLVFMYAHKSVEMKREKVEINVLSTKTWKKCVSIVKWKNKCIYMKSFGDCVH